MTACLKIKLFALAALSIAGAATGCLGTSVPERPLAFRALTPTKDEVVLVDGRALSISGFYALRTQLKNPSTEAVIWVAVATLTLQNETRGRGGELSTPEAAEIARYALGELTLNEARKSLRGYFREPAALPSPDQTKREVERLVSLSNVQRNAQITRFLAAP